MTRNVCSLFDQQVIQQPEKIAIYYSGITLTYQALDEQSNYLSNHLLSHAKQYDGKSGLSNDPVIVFMEKSLESIISIFAILKAGACYTPIDIDSPSERLKQIINESNASYILTTISAWGKIGSEISILSKVIFVDALLKNALLSEYTFHPNVKISPTDLAYIMFTSGSTGSPKGVMIEHGNLLASILARTESYPEKNQNCLLFSSLGFDTSITAIFWPLVQGGTLVIPEQSDSKDPMQIAHLIQKYKVTHLLITPSFYDLLLDQNAQHSLDSLQRVIVGGEQTHIFLVHKHKKNLPATFLTNEYGPTEASIWSTSIDLFDPKIMRLCEIVTVGHSAPHAKNYILNKNLQEVGVGETGEIYIAGDAVGRGYIGASDKECSNFMQDLIVIDKTGEKIKLSKVYKTGDLAKYLSSGEIVFIGRQDNQVKLGGQRVELSEIEAVLQSYKAVKQSIVRVKKGENYDYRLIAYITVAKPETFDIYVLRNFISKKLPSYMQPNEIIPLENFPLNQNGKINHLELLKLNEIAYENHILSKTSSNSYLEGQNRLVQCEYGQDQPEIAVDREVINKIEKICEIYRNILKKEVVMQHDNFFQLGGHSLLVVKTILEINQAFHSNITIRQFYSNPTPSGIVQCTIETGLNLPFYPLSYAQERMWFLHKYNNADDKHYNVAFWIEFFGELNVEALEKSLGRIIERHEVYRTVFVENDEGVFQQILPYKEFVLSRVQLRNVSAISHFISEDTSKSFNLSSGQLIRLRLITLNSQYHILLVNQHHIVHDGWSISLFKNELCSLYQYYAIGKELDLPNLPNQYKDFAQSQRQALLSGSYDSQLDYWISKLKNVSQLNLPTDYTRPLIQTYNGQHYKFLVSADLLQSIRAFASRLNLTVYMVLLTSFFILLSRYSNQKDIVTGTAIANRDDEKIQNLIGLFINTVAVRLQIEENTNIRELLLLVRDAVFEGLINKDVPFEHIINQLNLVRTIDKQPVFQTMFIYDRAEGDLSTLNLPGVRTAVHPAHNNTSKYDLSFNFQESTNNLDAFIEYNTDIYSNQSIANMAGHFLNLLNHITDDIEKNIYALNFITAEEQYLILNQWNAQPTFFNDGCLIHQLFEKHARISPQNPAIFCGEHFLTYEELNEQANQLAHYLYKKGVQPEEAIAVAIQRSFDLAIVLMAIFKVGAAYVPLDPNYPKARLQYMLENSEAKILITEAEIYADLNLQTSGEVIFIENIKNILNEEPRENLNIALRENNLALIHYTSGSTGDPKGVMLEQGDLCYCFKWLQKTFPLRSEDRMLQHTLYSFDVFICELFWPLIFGASSVLVEPHHEKDTAHLASLIQHHKIETFFCVPSMLAFLLGDRAFCECGSIKNVLSTGEALPIELKDKFYAETKANLYNLYGPTESTIFTSYEYCKPSATSITIGRPIDDKQVFILNERKQLQPVGIPGELCVAGRVGRGYYQMPELSQKRFFMQSFNGQLYKLYNTGDIARYLHDGRIEYLGRSDFQIKFKGHRVELSEIETCINKYQGIEKCVVDLKKYKGDSLLVAYYTTQDSAEKFDAQRLRDNLVEHLPNYMIPSFFIGLNSIPLTPSGKIDKKALPDLTEKYILHASAYVAPRNNIEFQLVKMLEQLLQVNKISINDDFFQLGGNSLMAVRFILSIKKNFGKTIPFALLFKKGTISEISKYMDIQPRDLISQTLLPIHQANNSKRTLFFAHPVEGLSYLYTPLASHLRKHSLYGLNNPYFYDRNKVFDSIEEMAEHYVKAIKTVQPNGPYYFCGWSSGGQVVYEMALQLKKQGFEVAAVILIDTYHSSIKIEHEDLDIRIPRVLISEGIDPNSEEGKYFKLEYKQNVALLQKYSEKIYDGRVVLIKAQQIASNIEDDLYNGWRSSLSKQIELYSIPGEHGRLLDLEHIENLSIILNGVLEGNPNTNILSDICLSEIDRQLHFAVLNKDPYLIKRCLSLGGNIEIVEHNHNKALL